MTLKGQGRDQNLFVAHYLEQFREMLSSASGDVQFCLYCEIVSRY